MTKSLVLCKVITNFSILFYFFQEPTLDSNGVEIKEPLDTIFVKSVRESGPAHLAGLQCGEYCKFRFNFVEFLWPFYPETCFFSANLSLKKDSPNCVWKFREKKSLITFRVKY